MGSELHHDCTNALYAFKSRGFGGEIGVGVARNLVLFESSFS